MARNRSLDGRRVGERFDLLERFDLCERLDLRGLPAPAESVENGEVSP